MSNILTKIMTDKLDNEPVKVLKVIGFDLNLNVSSKQANALELIYSDKLKDDIQVKKTGDTLEISLKNNNNISISMSFSNFNNKVQYNNKKPTINFSNSALKNLIMLGTGDVSGTWVSSDIDIKSTGSGDISLNTKSKNININNTGTGDINLKNSSSDLYLSNKGTGDVTISGHSSKIDINNLGTGDIDLKELIATDGTLNSKGTGDITANISNDCSIKAMGTGSIKLTQEPMNMVKKVSGLAEVKVLKNSEFKRKSNDIEEYNDDDFKEDNDYYEEESYLEKKQNKTNNIDNTPPKELTRKEKLAIRLKNML